MKDEFITRVGVWGQRHYNYLKKHFTTVINVMRMNGTLEQYIKDIDKDAKDMFDIVIEFCSKNNISYHIKKGTKSNT